MSNKDSSQKDYHGYFYKEKSGKEIKNLDDFVKKTDFKKYGKWALKGFKWGFYLFMIITTLWGCVQGFIIKQSNVLSHGFEIYQGKESVYPNMYLGMTTPIGKVSDEAKKLEVLYSTPASEGIPNYPIEVDDPNNPGIVLTLDQNNGCGSWTEDEDGNPTISWAVEQTSICWIDGNGVANKQESNFKSSSELWLRPNLLGSVQFGEYVGKDSTNEDVEIEDGVKLSMPTQVSYIDMMLIFKYNSIFEEGYKNLWNQTVTGSTLTDEDEDDDRFVELLTTEEIAEQKDEFSEAFLNNSLYIGTKDGLFYNSNIPTSTARGIEWDHSLISKTSTKEELREETETNDTKTIDDYFKEDWAAGQSYIPLFEEAPKLYMDIFPEQKGVHINADLADDVKDKHRDSRDDGIWNEASDTGDNNIMVESAGWSIFEFNDPTGDTNDQRLPTMYKNATDVTINEDGTIVEKLEVEPTDYLYRDTNSTRSEAKIENEWKNDINSTDASPNGMDDQNKLMPFVDYVAVEDEDRTYDYGTSLQFGGLNPLTSSESTWLESNAKIDEYYESTINNKIDPTTEIEIVGEQNPSYVLQQKEATEDIEGKSDYDISITPSGWDPNQKNRVIVTDWGEAWTYGPFYGMFVYPLSYLAAALDNALPEAMGGWSVFVGIFIIVFTVRGFSTLITFNNFLQQQKMQELQLKIAKINAKYEKHKDNPNKQVASQMKQRKQVETMKLYQKEGVNPLGSLSSVFITMPMFLAMWRIISSLPAYKGASIGLVDFTITPLSGIFSAGGITSFVYLMLLLATITMQFTSFKLPTWLSQKRKGVTHIDEKTKKAMAKNQKIGNWMIVFFVIMSITIPTLLALYWMLSGLFTLITTWLQHLYAVKKAEASKNDEEWLGPIDKTKKFFKELYDNKIKPAFSKKDEKQKDIIDVK